MLRGSMGYNERIKAIAGKTASYELSKTSFAFLNPGQMGGGAFGEVEGLEERSEQEQQMVSNQDREYGTATSMVDMFHNTLEHRQSAARTSIFEKQAQR